MANNKLQHSFWDFLRAFGQNRLTLMSGSLSVLLLIATTFVSYWNKVGLFLLAAACLIFASFQSWLDQQKEIARLRLRPYDEAQQGLASDLPRQRILADKLPDRKTEGSEQRSKKEQPSRLQKMVFGILGLLIVVGALVVKEIFRDRYKDSAEAINSAKAMFLLKNDTAQILGTVWELTNEPKPRRPGDVARFTIPAPVNFDTKGFFDSVSGLIEKLPDSEELDNRVRRLRARNDQFNKDSEKLYRVFSQHVVLSDPHRVDLTFDNYRDEMDFRKQWDPIKDQRADIQQEIIALGDAVLSAADKQKAIQERNYKRSRLIAFAVTFVGSMITLVSILKGVGGVEGAE